MSSLAPVSNPNVNKNTRFNRETGAHELYLVGMKLRVKTLYDRRTKPSRILCHSSDQIEIVKFNAENVCSKSVLKTLQRITVYVDSELENASGDDLIFGDDEDQQQTVYIMWMPTRGQIIGYLSAMRFKECYKLKSFVGGIVTTWGTTISEPVLGITRLWSIGRRREAIPARRRRKPSKDGEDEFVETNDDIILQCLLDTCRKTYDEGTEIMKSHLAFSYLTEELMNFLSKYVDYPSSDIRICFPTRRS